MIVYVEKIILINILVHLVLILTTHLILNNKLSKKGTCISVIIDGVFMIICIYFPNYNENIFFIIGLIIAALPFKSQKCYAAILYHMFNFMLGGVSDIIVVSINFFYELILLLSVILMAFVIFIKRYKPDLSQKILIVDNKKENYLNAFYDTGCKVYCGLTPVVLINSSIELDLDYVCQIEIETVMGKKNVNIYKACGVYCYTNNKKIEKHCFVAFVKMEYDCIIGSNLIGGISC